VVVEAWSWGCWARAPGAGARRNIYTTLFALGDVASTAVDRVGIVLSLLAVIFASAAFIAGLWIFSYVVVEWRYWGFRDFLGGIFLLCLLLAVLLTALSAYLVAKSAHEQVAALQLSSRTSSARTSASPGTPR